MYGGGLLGEEILPGRDQSRRIILLAVSLLQWLLRASARDGEPYQIFTLGSQLEFSGGQAECGVRSAATKQVSWGTVRDGW